MNEDRNRQSGPADPHVARTRIGTPLAGAALALLALGFVAAGCGHDQHKRAETYGGAETDIVAVPAYDAGSPGESAQAAVLDGGADVTVEGAMEAVPGDGSMPPDIIVTASNTDVVPGEVIDIAVQATPDVVEMSLWDGMGDRQALAYDADAKAWRVSYRVPLKLPWERTGLAITAKNEANRWCRAWVFIEMQQATPLADTTGVQVAPLAGEVTGPGAR